jgi:hypothetical protein
MADYKDFECILRIPEIDLGNVASARKVLIDVVNDPSFETMIGNLKVAAAQAKAGATPRGGEVSAGCTVDKGGHASCGGSVTIRW